MNKKDNANNYKIKYKIESYKIKPYNWPNLLLSWCFLPTKTEIKMWKRKAIQTITARKHAKLNKITGLICCFHGDSDSLYQLEDICQDNELQIY